MDEKAKIERELETVKGKIRLKTWFQHSSPNVQAQLMSLGTECLGYLVDLESRKDIVGGVEVIRMRELCIPESRPIFSILSVFTVKNLEHGTEYDYQYVSWKQGPVSGSKGILLIESEGEITHIIINQGEKFSTTQFEYDCPGGFADANEKSIQGLFGTFEKELKEELGIKEIKIKSIIDLGNLRVDVGMTNNHPKIFAAIIDASEADKISTGDSSNPDIFELRAGTLIIPVSKIDDFIMENDDSFFHICWNRFCVMNCK